MAKKVPEGLRFHTLYTYPTYDGLLRLSFPIEYWKQVFGDTKEVQLLFDRETGELTIRPGRGIPVQRAPRRKYMYVEFELHEDMSLLPYRRFFMTDPPPGATEVVLRWGCR